MDNLANSENPDKSTYNLMIRSYLIIFIESLGFNSRTLDIRFLKNISIDIVILIYNPVTIVV